MSDEEQRRHHKLGYEVALDTLLATLPCDRATFRGHLARFREAAGLYADVLVALAGRADPEMAEAYFQEARGHTEAVAGFVTMLRAYGKRHYGPA